MITGNPFFRINLIAYESLTISLYTLLLISFTFDIIFMLYCIFMGWIVRSIFPNRISTFAIVLGIHNIEKSLIINLLFWDNLWRYCFNFTKLIILIPYFSWKCYSINWWFFLTISTLFLPFFRVAINFVKLWSFFFSIK